MTTSPVRVSLESLDAWPRLGRVGLAAPFAVLSLDVRGHNHQVGIDLAARTFADVVPSIVEGQALAALVRLGSIDLSSRLVRYRFAKEGVWNLLAPEGLAQFSGMRRDWSYERPEAPEEYYGELRLTQREVHKALVAIWKIDSVVVCGDPEAWSGFAYPESVEMRDGLFESAAALLTERYSFVARGYGGFGESSCGIDVVAHESLLNRLAKAIQTGA